MVKSSILILALLISIVRGKLLFVFQAFRHGIRSPSFKTKAQLREQDDFFHVHWDKNQELTELGVRMMYLLGRTMRHKYSEFLPEKYSKNDVKVFSTDFPRTKMSAIAELNGLFPNQTMVIPDDLKYSHYPPNYEDKFEEYKAEVDKYLGNLALPYGNNFYFLERFDNDEHDMLMTQKRICPNVMNYKKIFFQSKKRKNFIDRLNEEYGKVLMELAEQNSTDFLYEGRNAIHITDIFICDYENNRDLSWFKETYKVDLDKFYEYCLEMKELYLFHQICDKNLTKLALSLSFPKLFQYMEYKIEQHTGKRNWNEIHPKLLMYSIHDTSLAPFLILMNITFGCKYYTPKFGAHILFELHSNDDKDESYYIKYFYNNELLLEVDYLKFKDLILNTIWDDKQVKQYCNVNTNTNNNNTIIFICVVVLFLLVISIGILKLTMSSESENKKRKGNKEDDDSYGVELINKDNNNY